MGTKNDPGAHDCYAAAMPEKTVTIPMHEYEHLRAEASNVRAKVNHAVEDEVEDRVRAATKELREWNAELRAAVDMYREREDARQRPSLLRRLFA